MPDPTPLDLETSYDRVADEYVKRLLNELDQKPFDCDCLDRFATRVAGLGPVADLGCGPGHVAQYLHERGVPVLGVDLSSAMIAAAQKLYPPIPFHRADFRSLPFPDNAWGGALCFYALIHVPPAEVVSALREIHRVLRPGGWLLLSFHVGDEVLHRDEWWGHTVSVDFQFFLPETIETALTQAGFQIEESQVRDPYRDVEYPSRRAYILARRL